ncbi:MAG: hypothetical protein L3J34_01070 [Flavobacteriaceae bacterium]|nr:hypothetical protein [Flavobacteriaceae bacterium]
MKYACIILFFTCLHLSAQDIRYNILGNVHNDTTNVENVHVINQTSRKGVITNKYGNFKIEVKVNDILKFTNIQFNNKIIFINKKHLSNNFISINIFQKTNILNEIVIQYPQNMAKSLSLPNADKKPLNKLERNLNAYSQKSTPMVFLDALLLSPILNGIPFITLKGGGIDDIYNIISGNRKRDRKLKSLLDKDKRDEINQNYILEIRDHYNDVFFINTLKIEQENINAFINYCIPENIIFLFNKKRYLDMVDIFINESKSFKND